MVGQMYSGKSWAQKLPEVQTYLTSNFDLIKRCSHDTHLYISDVVWSQELDIDRLRESAHPANHSGSVYSKNEVKTLRAVINDCVKVRLDITELEIAEFQHLLKSYGCEFGDHDASLMLVACKLGQSECQSVLISEDPDFQKPWQVLVQLGSFCIQGVTYNSNWLTIRSYAHFVTVAHDCCSCSSDTYRALFHAWLLPLLKRKIIKKRQGDRIDLFGHILSALSAMEVSLQNKPK